MGNFRNSCVRAGKIIYRCMQCGLAGVKLWREYNESPHVNELYCAGCAVCHSRQNIVIRPDGTHFSKQGLTSHIGSLIPAIPTIENETFWGLRGTPEKLLRWWVELPLKPGGKGAELPRDQQRKPAELLDLMVEYVGLSRDKSKIEKRQEELKEQIDEGLDLLQTEDFATQGYHAQWKTSTTYDYKRLVEDHQLEEQLAIYKRKSPYIAVSGPRE